MVSTFIQLLYHVIVQTNSRTVAAEGPEGVWELNTVCGGDAGAQLRDDRDNCISKFSFDSAGLPSVMRICMQNLHDFIYSCLIHVSLCRDDINCV